jgi:hypothetical protein
MEVQNGQQFTQSSDNAKLGVFLAKRMNINIWSLDQIGIKRQHDECKYD